MIAKLVEMVPVTLTGPQSAVVCACVMAGTLLVLWALERVFR